MHSMPTPRIRTSTTDPIRVDWLPTEYTAPGRVGLTFAPGKICAAMRPGQSWNRDLGKDLRDLRDIERVDVLVTLLEDHELEAMKIPGLFCGARKLGMTVRRLPIRDVDIPREPRRLLWLIAKIHEHIEAGENVAIHCAGGLGRTGVVAGCFLVSSGLSSSLAQRVLFETRGPRCPETQRQVNFIRSFEMFREERKKRLARAIPKDSVDAAPAGKSLY